MNGRFSPGWLVPRLKRSGLAAPHSLATRAIVRLREGSGPTVKPLGQSPNRAPPKNNDSSARSRAAPDSPTLNWLKLVVSADKLTITARGRPPNGATAVSPPEIEALFQELQVKVPIDITALRLLASQLGHGREAADAVLARGAPPTKGDDGRIEMCTDDGSVGSPSTENGSVDFREQQLVQTVRAGQCVARIVPPTQGLPGEDVYGQPIAGTRGAAASLNLGEHVRASEDGTEIYATADGAVSLAGATLSVKDTFTVRGDVDYATGNLSLERGSLLVEGDVRPGFRVSAAGDVLVRGVADSAQVISQADVRIGKGAFGGYVRAGGNAILRFAQNATIETDGDVLVGGGLVNSTVMAGGRVLCASGKGQIRGGSIRATNGIESKDLGSESHVRTVVEIIVPKRVMIELSMRLRGQEEALANVAKHIGNASDEEILKRVAEAERDEVAQLLDRRKDLVRRVARLKKIIDSEQRSVRNNNDVRILVHGWVYPGVVVNIGGANYEVRDPTRRVQFFYDREKHMIRMVPL